MPYARSNGATIYYEVRGSGGPPLLLIRGFASAIETWNGVDYDLAADHVTLVLDNRGVGRSTAPWGTYTVPTMAQDLAAVLSDAGLDAAHVVGTSLGGMIAQELALRHRELVQSLTLVATSPGKRHGFPLRTRGVAALALATFMPKGVRTRLVGYAILSPDARRGRREVAANRGRISSPPRTRLQGLIGQTSAIFAHQAMDRLEQIRVPTLVIHGGADNLIDHEHGRHLASLIPAARFEFWEHAGHDLATESPRRLAASIRRHVQDVIGPPDLQRSGESTKRLDSSRLSA